MSNLNSINFESYQNESFRYFENNNIEIQKEYIKEDIEKILSEISNSFQKFFKTFEYFSLNLDKSTSKLAVSKRLNFFYCEKLRDLYNSLKIILEESIYLKLNPLEQITFKNKDIYYIPLIKIYLENDKLIFIILSNNINLNFEILLNNNDEQTLDNIDNIIEELHSYFETSFNLLSSKINYLKICH